MRQVVRATALMHWRGRLHRRGQVWILTVSALCALLFLGFATDGSTGAAQVPMLFFALPVVACGIGFGLRGGLAAAAISGLLTAYGSELSLPGHISRSIVLVLVGAFVGLFADERRRLVSEIDSQQALSPDLMGMASFDGLVTRLNPAWTRTLGHDPAELLGQPFIGLFHIEDRDAAAAEAARLVEHGGRSTGFQNRTIHRDGSYRWIEWDVQADAETRSFIVVGRDITQRKQTEELQELRSQELALALEDAHETNIRLNLVAETVLDGLVTVSEDGTVLRFNTAAEGIFGYQREEVIGCNGQFLVADPAQEGFLARHLRTGEQGIIGVPNETVCRRKDGSSFPVEFTLIEVSHRGKRQFVTAFRDITERKRREDSEQTYREILSQTVRERTLELTERTREVDEARLETLRKLALAAEYRDDQTFEHAERVGMTAAMLGELLGLTARQAAEIRQAAPLHDIGKLAVSDTILLKRGELTAEQWEQMRAHPTVGHGILSGSNSSVLSLAAEIALSHHEWWDGSGYPAGLKREQIPLSGRLVALADVYDSLCHVRPYKDAWTVEQATAEIHRLRGRQFDPAVVDAFARLDPQLLAEHPPIHRAGPVGTPVDTFATPQVEPRTQAAPRGNTTREVA